MNHCIIMAGGRGARLWPESTAERPKQFLKLFGEKNLLASTIERIIPFVPVENIWIATGESLLEKVRESFSQCDCSCEGIHLLTEPAARNTAPCIAIAAMELLHKDENATMIVLPSDQRICEGPAFCRTLRTACELIEENPRRLATLGITPTFPATSYGYIEKGSMLESEVIRNSKKEAPLTYDVLEFHEKPDAQRAKEMLESGRFLWNAGIFVWKARRILELLRQFEPEIAEYLERIHRFYSLPDYEEVFRREFSKMKSISIDYAVMERAENIIVLEAPFSWDDLGSWNALDRIHREDRDESGNLALSSRLICVDSSNNLVRGDDSNPLFALIGVENLIVVQSGNTILVARKDQEERIREVISRSERQK